MFGTILISIVTLMHVYVFWRAVSVPFIKSRIPKKYIVGAGLILWILFYLGRVYGHHGGETLATVLEFIGMNWMAGLFLIFICLLAMDLITGFGMKKHHMSPLGIWQNPKMVQELGLTDKQVEGLKKADFAHREKCLELKSKLDVLHLELEKL
ncbi:MAG: hypothetical protein JRC88_13090, partial [Deltaproteobacteria bacterium]|nr:hypothetical protein [Deltaproteobacteria bacterium]